MRRDALRVEIDRILWEEWDPIGCRQRGGPDDEYRSYVGKVLTLLEGGADRRRIADHLLGLRTGSMGLPAGDGSDELRVATLLVELTSQDSPREPG